MNEKQRQEHEARIGESISRMRASMPAHPRDLPAVTKKHNSTYALTRMRGGANRVVCECRAGSFEAAVKAIEEHTGMRLSEGAFGYFRDEATHTSYGVAVVYDGYDNEPTYQEFMDGTPHDPNYGKITKPRIPEQT